MQFTEDQVIQLSPDASSTKAGQKLANTSKWVERYVHEKALWGACQGSGKKPYTTMIDLTNIAFKCSCPSRKFPCKHGLGLLFLYVKEKAAFTLKTDLADFVEEWLGKRENRQAATKAKANKPVDEKAQQKRAEKRQKKVAAGVEELQLWIQDTIRTGIMNIPARQYEFSTNITKRMVDAQAAGLAARLREMSNINFYEKGWEETFLKKISKTYLLTSAFKNIEKFPPERQKEIQTLLGKSVTKDEVLKGKTVRDDWLILGVISETEDRLRIEKVWLFGQKTERFAMILNFYAGAQMPTQVYMPGSVLEAEVVYYPETFPLRILVKETFTTKEIIKPFGIENLDLMTSRITDVLAINPFIEEIPFLFNSVSIRKEAEDWFLADAKNKCFLLNNSAEECRQILATSLGNPMNCFAIYKNEKLFIHSVRVDNRFYLIH